MRLKLKFLCMKHPLAHPGWDRLLWCVREEPQVDDGVAFFTASFPANLSASLSTSHQPLWP